MNPRGVRGEMVLSMMAVDTTHWDTRLAYISRRKAWRLQVTDRHTGETVETYYKRFSDADSARFALTAPGTTPAGDSQGATGATTHTHTHERTETRC